MTSAFDENLIPLTVEDLQAANPVRDDIDKEELQIDLQKAREEMIQLHEQSRSMSAEGELWPAPELYDYEKAFDEGLSSTSDRLPLQYMKEPVPIGKTDLRDLSRNEVVDDTEPSFFRKSFELAAQAPAGALEGAIDIFYNLSSITGAVVNKVGKELEDLADGMRLASEIGSIGSPSKLRDAALYGGMTPFASAVAKLVDVSTVEEAAKAAQQKGMDIALAGAQYAAEMEAVVRKTFPEADSLPESMVRGISQYLAGFIPMFRALKAVGLSAAPAMVIGSAAASGLAFGPDDPTLSTLLTTIDNPLANNVITQFLATDPNDTPRELAAKRAMEDVLMTVLGAGIGKTIAFTIALRKDAPRYMAAAKAASARRRLMREGLMIPKTRGEAVPPNVLNDLADVTAYEMMQPQFSISDSMRSLQQLGLSGEEASYVLRRAAAVTRGMDEVEVARALKQVDEKKVENIIKVSNLAEDAALDTKLAEELTRLFDTHEERRLFTELLSLYGWDQNPEAAVKKAVKTYIRIATGELEAGDNAYDILRLGSGQISPRLNNALALTDPEKALPSITAEQRKRIAAGLGGMRKEELDSAVVRMARDLKLPPAKAAAIFSRAAEVPNLTYRISLENFPGDTTMHLTNLRDADRKVLDYFEKQTNEILYDKQGRSKIAKEFKGWVSEPRKQGVGLYKDETNPVSQVDMLGADDTSKLHAEVVDSIHSLVTYQNAAGGHALVKQGAGQATAAVFRTGKPPEAAVLRKLDEILQARYGKQIPAVVADNQGLRIFFATGYKMSDTEFKAIAKEAGLKENMFQGLYDHDGFWTEINWQEDVAGNGFFKKLLELPGQKDRYTAVAAFQKFGPEVEKAHERFGRTHFGANGIFWVKVRHSSQVRKPPEGQKGLLLDPTRYRTGVQGAEWAYISGLPEKYRPRTFFYVDDPDLGVTLTYSDVEGVFADTLRWESEGKIPLYDMDRDPLNLWGQARTRILAERFNSSYQNPNISAQEINMEVERLLQERGFPGWFSRRSKAAVSYRPVAAKYVGNFKLEK